MNTRTGIPQEIEDVLTTHRRGFLRTAGLFAVSIGAWTSASGTAHAQDSAAPGPYPNPDFHQIDSWIVIHPDNTATYYVGKTDPGQGTGTAFRQMMSDELDIPFENTSLIMGSTDITVDQVGSGGSTAIERDAAPMRRVAAEARRVLLGMAATSLAVPVEQLTVSAGVIAVKSDPSKRVTYGELIGGKKFNVALSGANINAITGPAKLKLRPDFKYTGQPIERDDIPAKVDGSLKWAVDMKLPGMVHARNVKPPFACAKLTGIDESSVKNMPGFVRVMKKGNYVAVVCEREEQAISASRALKTTWEKPATAPFPTSENLFDYLRTAPVAGQPGQGSSAAGDADAAFAAAAKTIEAEYQIPFQGHTSFAGAHALADPSNGQMTIYSNDMKTYGMRRGIATFLGMPPEKVRVVYMQGPQGFGRTAAEDAAAEAAWIAQQLGRPVRMQWMREEETAWDSKSPAFLVKMRGALDANGNLTGYEYAARAADLNHLGYNDPQTTLIAQLMGTRTPRPAAGSASLPSDSYSIPTRRMSAEVVGLPEVWETPLRTGNLRDPNGPQSAFASESFIDEAAVAAKADPLDFRLKLLTAGTGADPGFRRVRSLAVLKAAAEKYGWDKRPSPKPPGRGNILTGRGVACTFRGNSVVAQIAEVEVNRQTGGVYAKRLVCAYDVGLVVNPLGLQRAAECATLHGLSRALYEEVRFDTEKVTSRDWLSHPTLRHIDVPEKLEVVLVNGDPNPDRPDLPSYGAGEAAMKPMMAAIANAIHDATGVRLRRVPFRPDRVLAALKAAKV